MEERKTFLSDRKYYPVFFMIVLTIVFVGALAIFYQLTQARVQSYKTYQLQKMILQTFKLPEEPTEQNYDQYISAEFLHGFEYYQAKKNDDILGYCFQIQGSGLWGTINALIALNEDFSELIGFRIIEQNETPGLGARITEEWFQRQFQSKSILQNGKVVKFSLVPEDEAPKADQIQQVTGATSSSRAVVNMLYKNLVLIVQKFNIQ